MTRNGRSATVIIPAHNEAGVLPRLLAALLPDQEISALDVIVVCNGCTDDTAGAARRFSPAVRVFEIDEASKAAALEAAREHVETFPVVFIDADVEIGLQGVLSLVERLGLGDIQATAPARVLDRSGVSAPASWYYDIWERLPTVASGLFGRGVIAVSEVGYARVSTLPRYTADDVAYAEAFAESEKALTPGAIVTVWPARTWRALTKRRIRAVQGMKELRAVGVAPRSEATSVADLRAIVRQEPRLILRLPVFVATTAIARWGERRRRFAGDARWMRDDTSRVT